MCDALGLGSHAGYMTHACARESRGRLAYHVSCVMHKDWALMPVTQRTRAREKRELVSVQCFMCAALGSDFSVNHVNTKYGRAIGSMCVCSCAIVLRVMKRNMPA